MLKVEKVSELWYFTVYIKHYTLQYFPVKLSGLVWGAAEGQPVMYLMPLPPV